MKFLSNFLCKSAVDKAQDNLNTLISKLNNFTFDDLDAQIASINEKMADMKERFSKTMDTFLEDIVALKQEMGIKDEKTLEIPYDRDTQIMKVKIGKDALGFDSLTITVSEDESVDDNVTTEEKTVVSIPNFSCPNGVTQKYDTDRKVMVFTFQPCDEDNNVIPQEETETPTNAFLDEVENSDFDLVGEIEEDLDDDVEEEPQVNNDDAEDDEVDMESAMVQDKLSGMSFRAIGRKYNMSDKKAAKLIRKHINC